MAYPTITNTFTSGTTAIHSQWNVNFGNLISGLADGSSDSNINNLTAASALAVTGDLYTVGLTDYTATSTINGWDAYTTKSIFYRKIGKMVFVYYMLIGTASAAYPVANFTLPHLLATNCGIYRNYVYNIDNTSYTVGYVRMYTGGPEADVYIYRDVWQSAWNLAVPKASYGCFSYEATA